MSAFYFTSYYMKRIKESFKKQGTLYAGHFIDDRLDPDDKVYLFDEIVDQMDLSELLESYGSKGGSLFSPRDMFAILLFSYYEGISSAYKIYDNVKANIRYIYLAGNLEVSRRAISDFRLRNLDFLRKAFLSTVKIANEAGLIDTKKTFSLDGSKIEANASLEKTASKKEWRDIQDKVLQHVEDYLEKCRVSDIQLLEELDEEKRKEDFEKIRERIRNLNLKKEKRIQLPVNPVKNEKKSKQSKKKQDEIKSNEDVQNLLDFCEKIEEACQTNESNFVNLTDPDCRLMQNDGVSKESYNVQVISNNQIIVAVDVSTDEQDQFQLAPMVNQLQENLEKVGIETREIILTADAGYNAGYNLEFLSEKENINAYISMYQRESEKVKDLYEENPKYNKENFYFDAINNCWVCPEGFQLELEKEYYDNKSLIKKFKSKLAACVFCKVRSLCLKSKSDIKAGVRTLEDRYILRRKEMKEKMAKPESKTIYKDRSKEVEPVFAQIKSHKGCMKFSLTTKLKVTSEFLIRSIAHNMGKILKKQQCQYA